MLVNYYYNNDCKVMTVTVAAMVIVEMAMVITGHI